MPFPAITAVIRNRLNFYLQKKTDLLGNSVKTTYVTPNNNVSCGNV